MTKLRDQIAAACVKAYMDRGHFDQDEVTDDDLYVADAVLAVVAEYIDKQNERLWDNVAHFASHHANEHCGCNHTVNGRNHD